MGVALLSSAEEAVMNVLRVLAYVVLLSMLAVHEELARRWRPS